MVIYVIGFIGSDRMGAARKVSEEYGIPLYDLAAEIKQRDGRSIRRMVITMGEHELRNKEYETLTAILSECGEPATEEELKAAESLRDPDLPAICSRHKTQAGAAGLCEGPASTASQEDAAAALAQASDKTAAHGSSQPPYSAVICCTDDVILDPMSADLIRTGKAVIVEEDPEAMLARAVALANTDDGDSLHYAFLLDPDKEQVRRKFMHLYEQRKPLYDSFR